MRVTWLLLASLLLLASIAGCAVSSSCTEADCEHEAIVTFPAGLVSGAYALMLESVITEEEVKREAGNSPGGATASPESSSTSSGSGASTPGGSPA